MCLSLIFQRYEFTWGVVFLEYYLLLHFSPDIWLHLGQHGTWKDEIKWKQCQSKTRSQKYSRTEKESHAGNYLLSNNFGSVFHIHNCLCKLFSFESLNYDPLLSILPIYFLRWRLFVLIIDVIQSHFNLSCKFLASDVQNRWSQRLNFENHIWSVQSAIRLLLAQYTILSIHYIEHDESINNVPVQ